MRSQSTQETSKKQAVLSEEQKQIRNEKEKWTEVAENHKYYNKYYDEFTDEHFKELIEIYKTPEAYEEYGIRMEIKNGRCKHVLSFDSLTEEKTITKNKNCYVRKEKPSSKKNFSLKCGILLENISEFIQE